MRYLLILFVALLSCNQAPKNPCQNLPEHTKQERLDKACCEAGWFLEQKGDKK